jgi:hypothetical protein
LPQNVTAAGAVTLKRESFPSCGCNEKTVLIPENHVNRLHEIVDRSWVIFQSSFIGGRHPVSKEASFQHHLADIISSVGALYCIARKDVLLVDLEVKVVSVKERTIDFRSGGGLVGLAARETPHGSRAAAAFHSRIAYHLIFPHVARRC